MILIEQYENGDRDLTSLVTVITVTPDTSNPHHCQAYIEFGDGVKDLDGSGGVFELVITVGGQTIQPSPQEIIFGTEVRSGVWSAPFVVPPNKEVILRVKSPNAADTVVDVTAWLYDIQPVAVDGNGRVDVGKVGGTTQDANNNSADINTILADLANDGRLDLLIDAIKAATDNLPADPASETNVNANETKLDAIIAYLDSEIAAILEDTGTTLPAILASILADTDFLQKVAEGDEETNKAVTPYRHLIKEKDTANVLVEKQLFDVDGADIDDTTTTIGQRKEPA